MRFHTRVLLALTFAAPVLTPCLGLHAQSTAARTEFGTGLHQVAPMEIGLNYVFIHANAPTSQCGCFSLNGGSATLVVNAVHGISLVTDLSSAHANHVDASTQNITLFNYLGGVRYSYRTSHRFTPYGEVLAGGSTESSNYAYVQSVNAFAASGGLGVNTGLGRHIGLTILEADYLYSRLPNASSNRQNDLRIVSGILFRLGPR